MTDTSERLRHLGLERNPFPPATTGAGFVEDLSVPERWDRELRDRIHELSESQGEKALILEGGYGAGKTYTLNWIQSKVLPEYRVRPYFFENPGVAFYDLANRLMRQVGRYEVAKALWEMLYPNDPGQQQTLFSLEFGQWLATLGNRTKRAKAIEMLSRALEQQDLAQDDEILNKLSRLIVETGERPYFEYRDFVPRSGRSLVAEQEEPRYFQALVRILGRISDANGIAFLLDEFEDVALGRRLNRSQASAYTSTLRRLLDIASREDLWVILSTTPEGLSRTNELDESLVQRFSYTYRIPELTLEDARAIVAQRLASARIDGEAGLWPFSEDALSGLHETSRSSPRRLIKIMWHAIGLAVEQRMSAPLSAEIVSLAEARLYAGTPES